MSARLGVGIRWSEARTGAQISSDPLEGHLPQQSSGRKRQQTGLASLTAVGQQAHWKGAYLMGGGQ